MTFTERAESICRTVVARAFAALLAFVIAWLVFGPVTDGEDWGTVTLLRAGFYAVLLALGIWVSRDCP